MKTYQLVKFKNQKREGKHIKIAEINGVLGALPRIIIYNPNKQSLRCRLLSDVEICGNIAYFQFNENRAIGLLHFLLNKFGFSGSSLLMDKNVKFNKRKHDLIPHQQGVVVKDLLTDTKFEIDAMTIQQLTMKFLSIVNEEHQIMLVQGVFKTAKKFGYTEDLNGSMRFLLNLLGDNGVRAFAMPSKWGVIETHIVVSVSKKNEDDNFFIQTNTAFIVKTEYQFGLKDEHIEFSIKTHLNYKI